jgi:glycosyltransferase involved in cell wall biosynthesis
MPRPVRQALHDAAVRLLAPAADPAASSVPARGCVTIAGLFSSPSGIGEGARLCAERFADVGYTVGMIDVTPVLGLPGGVAFARPDIAARDVGGPLIVHLNPPGMQSIIVRRLRGLLRGRRLIAYWAWEAPDLPPTWQPAFRLLHEIWVPSRFVADALLRAGCATPVRIVPHPLRVPPTVPMTRANQALTVLIIFAYDSGFDRKNPIAGIEAFRRAFDDADDAVLVIKSRGHSQSGEPERRLKAALAGLANVRLIDGDLPVDEYERLIESADVMLSLHRAEGFGIPLAEAMLRGKPVVATDWSGNLEFMDAEAACLVPARMVPMKDEVSAYQRLDSVWADADIDAAAMWLRRLRDPDLRATIGKAARQRTATRLGRDAFAAAVVPAVEITSREVSTAPR